MNDTGRSITADRPLIAYAFLAQASLVQGDLFSGLVPLFRPIVRGHAGQKFSASELIAEVKNLYGLDVHPWAIEDFAPRLEKAGLIAKHKITDSADTYVYASMDGQATDVTETEVRRIVQKFIFFARPILERNGVPVDERALEEAFFSQLVSMDFMAILVKPDRTKLDEQSASTLSLKRPKDQEEWENEVSARAKMNVLSAAFIVDCYLNDPPLYDLLVRIASGALIAEVVLNLGAPGTTVDLKGLRIVLDGPFLMSLLDVSSEESHKYALTLVNRLKEKQADIVTFRHCADEVRDNLRAVLSGVRVGGGYGATARRCGSPGFAAYVNAVANDIAASLKERAITLLDPPVTDSSQQFFTASDEDDFHKALGSFYNPLAQKRDAMSVAGVVRLRANTHVPLAQIHQARYLFVTENPWIAECSRRFCEKRGLYRPGEVPPAIPDRYLAGLAWVLFGNSDTQAITQYRLLANCTTALEGRRDVVSKMYRFLTDLDEAKATRFRALMTTERAGQYLMQLTLGDSLLIRSTDDAEAILSEMEASLGEKYKRESEQRLRDASERHQRELQTAAQDRTRLEEEVRDAGLRALLQAEKAKSIESQKDATARQLAEERAATTDRIRGLIEKCATSAVAANRRAHVRAAIAVLALTGFAAYLTSDLISWGKPVPWLVGAALTALIAFAGFGKMPDLLFGKYFKKVRDATFRRECSAHNLEDRISSFEVDWDSTPITVRLKTERSADRGHAV